MRSKKVRNFISIVGFWHQDTLKFRTKSVAVYFHADAIMPQQERRKDHSTETPCKTFVFTHESARYMPIIHWRV